MDPLHTPTLSRSTNTVLATLSAVSKTGGRARKEAIQTTTCDHSLCAGKRVIHMTTRNPTRSSAREHVNSRKRWKTCAFQYVRRVNSMSLASWQFVPPPTCGRLWLTSLVQRVLSRAFVLSPHACHSRSKAIGVSLLTASLLPKTFVHSFDTTHAAIPGYFRTDRRETTRCPSVCQNLSQKALRPNKCQFVIYAFAATTH